MVFKLSDICIQSIVSGIETGQINGHHLAMFPPSNPNQPSKNLRHRILDWILAQRKIKNPNCIQALTSNEFLDGITSISTLEGQINDREYLDRLAESLGSIGGDGQPIGTKITKLELILFAAYNPNNQRGEARNFRSVVSVIAKCPNLKSLSLKVDRSNIINRHIKRKRRMNFLDDFYVGDGLLNELNEFQPCLSILENLESLSLNCDFRFVLGAARPVIQFKNLSKLSVSYAVADGDLWQKFLADQGSLVSLHVEQFKPFNGVCDLFEELGDLANLREVKIGPTSARHPNSEYVDGYIFDCSLSVFSFGYDNMERVSIVVVNESSRNIADQRPGMDIEIDLFLIQSGAQDDIFFRNDDPEDTFKMLSDPPRFEQVDLWKEKIKSIHFRVNSWNLEYAAAFEHFVQVCPNVTNFEMVITKCEAVPDLSVLFNDLERTRQLRSVELMGDIDFGLMFENCKNLDKLMIRGNRLITDDHLIQWATQGGRLRELIIGECPHFTDRGLVPILINSGTKLVKAWYDDREFPDGDKVRVHRILGKFCPFVKEMLLDYHDAWGVMD